MLLTRCCNLIGQPNIPGWDTKTCRECPDVFFRADSPRPLVIRACVHVGKIRLARETTHTHKTTTVTLAAHARRGLITWQADQSVVGMAQVKSHEVCLHKIFLANSVASLRSIQAVTHAFICLCSPTSYTG